MSRVAREQSVGQSVQDFIRQALTERGFPMAEIEMKDAFANRDFGDDPVTKEYVALGFTFDDGGVQIELGSNLRRYNHQVEVFVIATSATKGEAIGYGIRDALESAERIPLKDVSQAGRPIIDVLMVEPVRVERAPVPDPAPWEEFVWVLRIPIIDEYDPATTEPS
jgi:hypothetical protein